MISSTKSLLTYLQPNAHIQAIYTSTIIRFIHSAKYSHVSNIKPYDQIPTKSGLLPASIDLLLSGGADYLHEHCDRRHKQLGPIYRDYLGNIEIVFVGDAKLIQTVVANEGQYPRHNVPEAWSFYNELHNIERGLFFQMGEPWYRLRKVFNKVMLADPKSTARFTNDLFKINDDLLDSWKVKFNNNQTAVDGCIVVPDIKAALCNWSIESTGCMLFGSRMGCVPERGTRSNQAHVDPRASELVKYVTEMFIETSNFQMIPVRLAHKLGLGAWKRFDEATTGMLRIANLYAAENLDKISKNPQSKSILADILRINTLSRDEISRSLVDLIIAAADTTSAALQWMIYLLAKQDQNLQSKILCEINDALVDGDAEKFKENVPSLKAFIRESLRLYPTAPFLARTLDCDIVLNGYKIPAGKLIVFTLYTTSRMDKYFDDPLEFKPERWLRSSSNNQQMVSGENVSIKQPPTSTGALGNCPHVNDRSRYAYASLPFGIGARMCVGRRAAELQMMTYLASFVRKFNCKLSCGNENDTTKVKLKMILAPTKPISIKLNPR